MHTLLDVLHIIDLRGTWCAQTRISTLINNAKWI